MNNLVLDLVVSCENRISMVEEMVTGAHCETAALDFSLGELASERARLEASLRDLLAQNCSLRKKDFDDLIESIISERELKRQGLEEEQGFANSELRKYLDEQKRLVAELKTQLWAGSLANDHRDVLLTTIAGIKANQHAGERVFVLLRRFKARLDAFRREQEEMNRKMQRLVQRGELLRLDDVRQLEATRAGKERRNNRALRRQQVGRLLAQFKEHRQRQRGAEQKQAASEKGEATWESAQV